MISKTQAIAQARKLVRDSGNGVVTRPFKIDDVDATGKLNGPTTSVYGTPRSAVCAQVALELMGHDWETAYISIKEGTWDEYGSVQHCVNAALNYIQKHA